MADDGVLSLMQHLPPAGELMFSALPGVLGAFKDIAMASSLSCTASLMVAMTVFVFVASSINKNYSWVDRLWSIMPVVYAWVIALYTVVDSQYSPIPLEGKPVDLIDYMPPFVVVVFNLATRKVVFYAVLITVWGVRLTYNFARKGGYRRGGEDYRWNFVQTLPVVKAPLVWPFFNLIFISAMQSVLLFLLPLPLYAVPATAVGLRDVVMGVVFLVFLATEVIADQQQWNFFLAKRRGGQLYRSAHAPAQQMRYLQHDVLRFAPEVPSSEHYDTEFGFCYEGAFGYSRHLNVFAEQCMWVTMALAAWISSSPEVVASTFGSGYARLLVHVGGAAFLIVLTIASTMITEHLSSLKYPGYRVYQHTTPMFFPTVHPTSAFTRFSLRRMLKVQ